jgi:hypothetical protein
MGAGAAGAAAGGAKGVAVVDMVQRFWGD